MLTVSQYRQINASNKDGAFDKMINVVNIVTDVDPSDWSANRLVNEYKRIIPFTNISERYSERIVIEDTELCLIPFQQLRLGQFIDIEALVSENIEQNLHKIAASLYLMAEGGGLKEQTFERYAEVNVDYRSQLIDELPCAKIYGAVKKYQKFRENFFKSYDIFNDPFEHINVDELEGEDLEDYNEQVKAREKESGNQWMMLLNNVGLGDITKFEPILDSNLFLVFNQLTYLQRK